MRRPLAWGDHIARHIGLISTGGLGRADGDLMGLACEEAPR